MTPKGLLLFAAVIACVGSPPPSKDGEACEADDDCLLGRTCLTDAEGYPDGTCSIPCELQTDCEPGGMCIDFTAGTYCMSHCAYEGDGEWACREGWVCALIPFIWRDVCLPGAS